MNIQLALDRLTKEACFELIEQTSDSIDIIELGTGVVKEYGMAIVKETKEKYANLLLLADMKTCDAGKAETIQAFESGADMTTVMAFSDDQTISDALEVAKQYNKHIMIDLLGVESRERVAELVQIGCNLFCIHVGKDKQQHGEVNFKELLYLIEGFESIDVAIAGGINAPMAKELADSPIDILIVGSAITAAADPELASREISNQVNKR